MHVKRKFVMWLSIFLSIGLASVMYVSPMPAAETVATRRLITPHEASVPISPAVQGAAEAGAKAELARQRWNVQVYLNKLAENEEAERARQAAIRARKVREASRSSSQEVSETGRGDTWACIREHESESSGGYAAVNPNGHYGAYQFSQATWNATARRHGRVDLVGVRPDQASAADQDQMAQWLQADSGWSQWSTHRACGV